MVVEVPPDLKVVALFAITLLVWWHFPPPLFHFDGTFRHHNFFLAYLSGGAFCRHFTVLVALFATTLWFWGRFLPPFARFVGAFCPHSLDSPIQLSLSPLHLHPTSHFLLSQHHLPTIHLFQAVYPLHPVHLSQNPQLPLHNPFLRLRCGS